MHSIWWKDILDFDYDFTYVCSWWSYQQQFISSLGNCLRRNRRRAPTWGNTNMHHGNMWPTGAYLPRKLKLPLNLNGTLSKGALSTLVDSLWPDGLTVQPMVRAYLPACSPCNRQTGSSRLTRTSGTRLNIKTVFPRYGDSRVKDKTVTRRLIFNMAIPILIRRQTSLYTETHSWGVA